MIAAIVLAAALTADQVGICRDFGELAAVTMQLRQIGAPRSMLEGSARNAATGQELFIRMLEEAYAETRWHTEGSQTRAIEDFRDRWEAVCFDMFKEPAQ